MTDDEIFDAFVTGRMTSDLFDHKMHIHVGWLHVIRLPLNEALAEFSQKLKALTVLFGVADKYHETITWFYILLINERQTLCQAKSFEEFIRKNIDLLDRNPSILRSYYSPERLSSELARNHCLMPDRLIAG